MNKDCYSIITGASSGIGKELAAVLSEHDHNLILISRSESSLNELKNNLERNKQIKIVVLPADLAKPESAMSIVQQIEKMNLKVNLLINNAGFGFYGNLSDQSIENMIQMIQLNITSLSLLTRLFIEKMKEIGGGKILNVASTAAFRSGPMSAVYSASKSYVLSFSEALSTELQGSNISITALCPGATNTNFASTAGLMKNQEFKFKKSASPRDVAEYSYREMMKGKTIAVHGLMNRLIIQLQRILPRNSLNRIIHLKRRNQ